MYLRVVFVSFFWAEVCWTLEIVFAGCKNVSKNLFSHFLNNEADSWSTNGDKQEKNGKQIWISNVFVLKQYQNHCYVMHTIDGHVHYQMQKSEESAIYGMVFNAKAIIQNQYNPWDNTRSC